MKKLISVIVVLTMVTSLFMGCSKESVKEEEVTTKNGSEASETTKDDEKTETTEEEVVLTIPHYKAGQNVGGKFFLPQVERFNKMYEGTYKIVIDEIPQDSYTEKIKQLAQQDKLPALIEGAEQEWFEKVIIANDKYYDLSSWLDENKVIKDQLIPDSLKFNTYDSSIVSLPLSVVRPIGLFYNSDMIDGKDGIGKMTIDEFAGVLEDSEQKMAFMTSENAWTTSLFFTSIVLEQPGGMEAIKDGIASKVTDYTSEMWINSFTKLQYFLQNLASSNTLGAAYADAANSFMSESSAAIANGPWMVGDFSEDSVDKWSNDFNGNKVKADVYPGNVAIASTNGYYWWIPSGLPQSETDAALAFLAFINSPEEIETYMLAEGGIAPNLEPTDAFLAELANNRILSELDKAVNSETTFTPLVLDAMPASVANLEFGKLLPKLIDGTFTPAEFAEKLSVKAVEAME